ncbi:MAG: DHH family phosphoesterase [Bacillota bacterium]|nr:DHH family phosphoesterase [Bacillota bacterium]
MDRLKKLSKYKLTILLLVIIVIALFALNDVAGLVGLVLAVIIVFEILYRYEELESKENDTVMRLCENLDSAAQDSIFNMPFPLVLTDEKGLVDWYNPSLLKLIDQQQAVGLEVDQAIEGFSFDQVLEGKQEQIYLKDKNYLIYSNKVKKQDGKILYVFYLVDNTDFEKLKTDFNNRKVGFAHVYIDNYDEIGLEKKSYIKSVIVADIEKEIMAYFTGNQGIVRKYEDDKYLVVFNNLSLENMVKDKFSILDKIRDIGLQNESTITLSVGVSQALESIPESYEESRIAVDLALGRGGDQVVLRTKEGHEFFGGRTQAKEKRNRVRARVIGNSLRNLIEESSEVYIMGHKNADMDSIGSAIGMLGSVKRLGKPGYIVLNEVNPSIKIIMEQLQAQSPDLYENVIKSSQAFENAKKTSSLLICLDNHKIMLTEEPRLFEIIDKVVIIDHHRKGNDAIENFVLSYIEPYASSTAELVTEILEYMEKNLAIDQFEAEAMMAGIVVDTKNFTFQTGVRTFEAASVLRRHGADPTRVNKLFNEDMDTVRLRARVIHDADIIRGEIAIAILDQDVDSNILIAAKAADSLLNIVDVSASFVLTVKDDMVHISGRSSGDISVQLILEKLGGGGHLTSAATQLKGVNLEQAYQMLISAIDQYYEDLEREEKENEDNTTEGL